MQNQLREKRLSKWERLFMMYLLLNDQMKSSTSSAFQIASFFNQKYKRDLVPRQSCNAQSYGWSFMVGQLGGSNSHSRKSRTLSILRSKRTNHGGINQTGNNGDINKFHSEEYIPEINLCRKPKQKRRKPKHKRRPSSFWKDISNIESELRIFWSNVNVPIPEDEPPPIPNEALLNHFERHDLRYAIANIGGRKTVSEKLGGARMIPGKWSDAWKEKEVFMLLQKGNPAGKGLSRSVPPIAPHVKRTLVKGRIAKMKRRMHNMIMKSFLLEEGGDDNDSDGEVNGRHYGGLEEVESLLASTIMVEEAKKSRKRNGKKLENAGKVSDLDKIEGIEIEPDILDIAKINDEDLLNLRYPAGERWAHRKERKPRGYWNQNVVISELYEYLAHCKESKERPSVWMPRPSEIAQEGREDLKLAISRFGGAQEISKLAGLVPYKEWRYFESQLELFIELKKYLAIHEEGREDFFPKLGQIQNNGNERLYDLVMEFGGRKVIATRLNMEYQAQTKVALFQGMSFGKFSLGFAIRLMHFIRNQMLAQEPPLENATIRMPTIKELISKGENELAKEVIKYGGHECTARRLNLTFDQDEAQRDTVAKARKEASEKMFRDGIKKRRE